MYLRLLSAWPGHDDSWDLVLHKHAVIPWQHQCYDQPSGLHP